MFAAIWLFFLLDPLLEALGRTATRSPVSSAWLVTVVFGAYYMTIWVRLRRDRNELRRRTRRSRSR